VNADVKIEVRLFFHRVQDRQSAPHGFERAGEDHEALVAAHLDLLAAMPLDERLHQLPMPLANAKTAPLVRGHQGRIPNGIREENGR
jgi:hypothetical protein